MVDRRGRHARGGDTPDELGGVTHRVAAEFRRNGARPLEVVVGDGDQLRPGKGGVQTRVMPAEVTDAHHPDGNLGGAQRMIPRLLPRTKSRKYCTSGTSPNSPSTRAIASSSSI